LKKNLETFDALQLGFIMEVSIVGVIFMPYSLLKRFAIALKALP
jgi:hypothetical protein